MQYENTEKYPLLLGSVQVHLYDVIQVSIKVIFFTMVSHCPVGVCCYNLSVSDGLFLVYYLPANSYA